MSAGYMAGELGDCQDLSGEYSALAPNCLFRRLIIMVCYSFLGTCKIYRIFIVIDRTVIKTCIFLASILEDLFNNNKFIISASFS